MSNVIHLFAKKAETDYQARVNKMRKVELLEDMVRFQEERKQTGLTSKLMSEGVILFKALEDVVDTPELRILSRSYRRHLEYEIASLNKV